MTEYEYLERRLIVTEQALLGLGEILMIHLPAIGPQVFALGSKWEDAIDNLDAERSDTK